MASNYVADSHHARTHSPARQASSKCNADVLTFIDERLEGRPRRHRTRPRPGPQQSQAKPVAALHQLQIDLRHRAEPTLHSAGHAGHGSDASCSTRVQDDRFPSRPILWWSGIPADLLRRRPDVRRAERLAAAQAEQIGIAEADCYPAFSITGNAGLASGLGSPTCSRRSRSPAASARRFMERAQLRPAAQQCPPARRAVSRAGGLLSGHRAASRPGSRKRHRHFPASPGAGRDLRESVDEAWIALQVIVAQYEAGLAGSRLQSLCHDSANARQQQDSWAQSRGQIAQGLIQVYRALGGGWQIKLGPPPDKQGILSPLPRGRSPSRRDCSARPKAFRRLSAGLSPHPPPSRAVNGRESARQG